MLKRILSVMLVIIISIAFPISAYAKVDNSTYFIEDSSVIDECNFYIVQFKYCITPGRSKATVQKVMDCYFNQGPKYEKIAEYYKLCNSDERGDSIQVEGKYLYFGQMVDVKVGLFLKDKGEVLICVCTTNPVETEKQYNRLVKKYITDKDDYTTYSGPPREYVPTAVNGVPTGVENSNDLLITGTYYDWRRD